MEGVSRFWSARSVHSITGRRWSLGRRVTSCSGIPSERGWCSSPPSVWISHRQRACRHHPNMTTSSKSLPWLHARRPPTASPPLPPGRMPESAGVTIEGRLQLPRRGFSIVV
ncbi:Os02g0433900 [Oryza sativa Japonica Group]|uniref:Os02g0433900 protein n=2 Tax=Oryza sativa subsp. japonica TaxID=39947 RepID=B7EIG1_ORYSJ|nr:hypothetical protein DAI22_02g150800 [Oryza sativa Japonica Group]BAF08645.1 Os02g0433900 [Oryza sativa Japonica Group]BAG92158.1 unnamed protein product [Oryza sativa Japonica Group]|eukprot:NP_001046731.1 Os02g0433900 [Oryza sativa Japonica Group]